MGTVFPFARRAPLELRRFGSICQGLAGGNQCFDVHAIINWAIGIGHGRLRVLVPEWTVLS